MGESRLVHLSLIILGIASLSCQIAAPLSDQPAELAAPIFQEPAPRVPAAGAIATRQPSPDGSDEQSVREIAALLSGRHTGLLPGELESLARAVVTESRRGQLSPALVLAVIEVESNGFNFAMSNAGALGLMQLLPSTAEPLAHEIGVVWRGPATLLDPVANVRLGVAYLRRLVDRFGDVEQALVAYNWGPTRIAARLNRGQTLPGEYARRVRAAFGGPLAEGGRFI